MTKRYVWLDLNTGKFSNSWGEDHQAFVDAETIQSAKENNWKLISYECLTDDNFEFYDRMIVVSNKDIQMQAAVEFGYKQCESGNSLELALSEAKKLLTS